MLIPGVKRAIKSANSEAYILGEIWSADSRWVGEGHFDGLMNYPIMEALSGLLATNTLDVVSFGEKVEGLLSYYLHEHAYAMYLPLDSHDTARILTRMGNDLDKTKLAYLFQFAYPGAPAIYYGDEIGLTGGKDPGCRGAFLWDENRWNTELRNFIKTLVAIRKRSKALRRGEYNKVEDLSTPSCFAFTRRYSDEQVLVIINASPKQQSFHMNLKAIGWDDGRVLSDLAFPQKKYTISNQALEILL